MSEFEHDLSPRMKRLAGVGVLLLVLPIAVLSWVVTVSSGDVTPEAFTMGVFSLTCFLFVGFVVSRLLSSERRDDPPVVRQKPQALSDRLAVLIFAAPFLPLGLVVLSSMADENYRYLPDWAPVWAAWCFGIVAACLGASALWTGLRSGD